MKSRLKTPSASLGISLIALFVALGGTSYAAVTALPKNSVGTKQLKDNAVTGAKIASGAVTASKINTSGLTVPTATHATTADSATSASSATNATNAANAAKLGDQLPSFYLPASAVHRIGPTTVPACTSLSCTSATLITLGQLSFTADCEIVNPGDDGLVDLSLTSSADGGAYADTTSLNTVSHSQPDMTAQNPYELAVSELSGALPVFVSVTGTALSADGHQIFFDLSMAQNARGTSDGGCVFGGSFVVT